MNMGIFTRKKKEQRNTDNANTDNSFGVGGLLFRHYNSYSATSLSSVFSAIELISNSVAELPIIVKRRIQGGKDVDEDHNLNMVFRNMLISKFVWLKCMITDLLLYGNAFSYIERSGDGTVTDIIYFPHGDVSIQWRKNKRELFYMIPSLKKGRIEPIDMIHLYKNTTDGIKGRGILEYAYKTLLLAGVTEEQAINFFSSGCNLGGILTVNQPSLSPKQKQDIRQAWEESHGTKGMNGIAVLPASMTYQQISSNASDSQLLETRLFNVQEISRFFQINPTLLGDLSKTSYSTIEASNIEFLCHTLMPFIKMIEDEFNRKLIKPSETDLVIDIDESFVLRGDKTATANYLSSLVNNGIMTRNEARIQLGLSTKEGCDELIIPYTKIDDNTINDPDVSGSANTNTSDTTEDEQN